MGYTAKELIEARIALARALNEQRAAETRADADARREKLRRGLAGPKKRFGQP